MNFRGKCIEAGPSDGKKKQGIPQHPCDVRRIRGRPTAGPPLLSFSCVPLLYIFRLNLK